MTLYLNEKIALTEWERNFAMYVISKAVAALRESKTNLDRNERSEDSYEGLEHMRERGIGYAYGVRNTAQDIAGSSLSALFGGMGIDTMNALEVLAKRDEVHTFCPIIVEEFYEELTRRWNV